MLACEGESGPVPLVTSELEVLFERDMANGCLLPPSKRIHAKRSSMPTTLAPSILCSQRKPRGTAQQSAVAFKQNRRGNSIHVVTKCHLYKIIAMNIINAENRFG